MRVRTGVIIVFCMGCMFAACSGNAGEMPEDFSLSFAWNTGSLPPKHRYEYVITIGPGEQGELDYTSGYGGPEDANRWTAPFSLTEQEMASLFQYLQVENMIRSNWNTGRGLIGGSTTSLIIQAYGKEYRVPSISELEDNDRSTAESAMDVIRGYVPESIWNEMEERQRMFEANYQD